MTGIGRGDSATRTCTKRPAYEDRACCIMLTATASCTNAIRHPTKPSQVGKTCSHVGTTSCANAIRHPYGSENAAAELALLGCAAESPPPTLGQGSYWAHPKGKRPPKQESVSLAWMLHVTELDIDRSHPSEGAARILGRAVVDRLLHVMSTCVQHLGWRPSAHRSTRTDMRSYEVRRHVPIRSVG